MGQSIRKIVWLFFKKFNRHIPYDSAIQILGNYPREMKTLAYQRFLHKDL